MCKQTKTRLTGHNVPGHLHIMETNPATVQQTRDIYVTDDKIRVYMYMYNHTRHTTTANMTTMGNTDTFSFMMITRQVINISFQSPKLGLASWTHATPYTAEKVTERIFYTLTAVPTSPFLVQRLRVILHHDKNDRMSECGRHWFR